QPPADTFNAPSIAPHPYNCCDIAFLDFHALLEHLELAHVLEDFDPAAHSTSEPPSIELVRPNTTSVPAPFSTDANNNISPPSATMNFFPSISKPFCCPRPGCTKSYKHANGLEYHLSHSSCRGQDLEPVTENRNSALHPSNVLSTGHSSSRDRMPATDAEKNLRPFACGVGDCPRRYKNINGLRYHYWHSGAHGAPGLARLKDGTHQCLQMGNGNEGMSQDNDHGNGSDHSALKYHSVPTPGMIATSACPPMSSSAFVVVSNEREKPVNAFPPEDTSLADASLIGDFVEHVNDLADFPQNQQDSPRYPHQLANTPLTESIQASSKERPMLPADAGPQALEQASQFVLTPPTTPADSKPSSSINLSSGLTSDAPHTSPLQDSPLTLQLQFQSNSPTNTTVLASDQHLEQLIISDTDSQAHQELESDTTDYTSNIDTRPTDTDTDTDTSPLSFVVDERNRKPAQQNDPQQNPNSPRQAIDILEYPRSQQLIDPVHQEQDFSVHDEESPTTAYEEHDSEVSGQTRDQRVMSLLDIILNDPRRYQRVLQYTGPDAQVLIDTCQELLDSPGLMSNYRWKIVTAMQRLSGKTGTYPTCFFLRSHISLAGEHAISSGSYGDIYKATARNHEEALCLKVLRANQRILEKMTKSFAKEAILWSQLSHPNVLPFYGLYLFRSQLSFISPYAENGNIMEYLSLARDSPDRIFLANVLVDRSGRAYLADFGLSNVDDPLIAHWTSQSSVGSKGGSARWQAPELHQTESDDDNEESPVIHNTEMSDIFAWGCLCYERWS
ncbi:hypothetical protein C0991_005537, partial [Blastosporella zonata]